MYQEMDDMLPESRRLAINGNRDQRPDQHNRPYRRSLVSLLLTTLSVLAIVYFSASLTLSTPGISGYTSPDAQESDEMNRLVVDRNVDGIRIAIFADLHLGEKRGEDPEDKQDSRTAALMAEVLAGEKPDMVVLDGDLLTGEGSGEDGEAGRWVRRLVQPMADARVLWASTYGGETIPREAIYAAERRWFPLLSMTRRMGPRDSDSEVSNYYVLVERTGTGPVAVLWFFDSGEHGRVSAETARWFRRAGRELREWYGVLPSLAFVHAPPGVYRQAAGQLDPETCPGLDEDKRPLDVQGEDGDEFADALRDEEGLHSVYSGHDHGSAWCAPWPGSGPHGDGEAEGDEHRQIHRHRHEHEHEHDGERGRRGGATRMGPILCFARRTGYGGYGDWERGARIVDLRFGLGGEDEQIRVESWVSMEGGEAAARVTLNETYGVDRYPSAAGRHR